MSAFTVGTRVRYTGAHPAGLSNPNMIGKEGTVVALADHARLTVRWDGRPEGHPLHNFYPQNLEVIPVPKLDPMKQLTVIDPHRVRTKARLIGTFENGHVLVETQDYGWVMFDAEGRFARSADGSGTDLRLSDTPSIKTVYLLVNEDGSTVHLDLKPTVYGSQAVIEYKVVDGIVSEANLLAGNSSPWVS